MSDNNVRVRMLAEQIKGATQILHGTMDGVTAEVAHQQPGGTANSIAANIAHVITAVDGIVNGMLQGKAPIGMSADTGLSAPPPRGEQTFQWHDWGTSLTVDLDKLHGYAGQVFASVEEYMGGLADSDLDTKHETPAGERTTFEMLNGAVLNNLTMHAGEISALKGMQGLKGYPF